MCHPLTKTGRILSSILQCTGTPEEAIEPRTLHTSSGSWSNRQPSETTSSICCTTLPSLGARRSASPLRRPRLIKIGNICRRVLASQSSFALHMKIPMWKLTTCSPKSRSSGRSTSAPTPTASTTQRANAHNATTWSDGPSKLPRSKSRRTDQGSSLENAGSTVLSQKPLAPQPFSNELFSALNYPLRRFRPLILYSI